MRVLPSILSIFRNEFNKSNDTGARMLDSIYHMTLNYFEFIFFGVKMLGFCRMRDVKTFPENLYTTSVFYQF